MKKLTVGIAAATLALAFATASYAEPSVGTSGNVSVADESHNFSLSTSYDVVAGSTSPNAYFTVKLDTSTGSARPIGYFTVTGLTDGDTYSLGTVEKTGADATGVGSACFLATAGDNKTVCQSSNTFLNDASSKTAAYVQIDHVPGAAKEGVTFVTIPVTAFKS